MNNNVELIGYFEGEFIPLEGKGIAKFYLNTLCIERLSGYVDKVPVMVSEELLTEESYAKKWFQLKGRYTSTNEGTHLILRVRVTSMEPDIKHQPKNVISLIGCVCRDPIYRTTPKGTKITDLFISVKANHRKMPDYLPCICWEKKATEAAKLKLSDFIHAVGCIHSREYTKKLDDGSKEERIAYEVSINEWDPVKPT